MNNAFNTRKKENRIYYTDDGKKLSAGELISETFTSLCSAITLTIFIILSIISLKIPINNITDEDNLIPQQISVINYNTNEVLYNISGKMLINAYADRLEIMVKEHNDYNYYTINITDDIFYIIENIDE